MVEQNEPRLTPQQALAQTLDDCQPNTLLVCGTLPVRLGRAWHEQHPDRPYTELLLSAPNNGLPPADTHDLALIEGALEQLSHEDGALMLGQLRNFGTHRIAVIMTNESGWQLVTFSAWVSNVRRTCKGSSAHALYLQYR